MRMSEGRMGADGGTGAFLGFCERGGSGIEQLTMTNL